MQFLRQQSSRWNNTAPRPSSSEKHGTTTTTSDDAAANNIAPLKDDDDVAKVTKKIILEQQEKDDSGVDRDDTIMGGNGDDGKDGKDVAPATSTTTTTLTSSVSSFLQRRKSSIWKLSCDVSQQAQQQAAAAAAAYEQYQHNKVMEQEDVILQHTIRQLQVVHDQLKEQQQTNRSQWQEYQKEQADIKAQKNALARDLWLKEQNNKLNPLGLKEYKVLFLPESSSSLEKQQQQAEAAAAVATALDVDDASTTSLVVLMEKDQHKLVTAQAKLCRAQHNEWMTDRQMVMMRNFQQEMIDFMFHGMLPTLQSEKVQLEEEGKNDIEHMKQSKQELEELYLKMTALQEQLLEEYRSKLTPEELEALQQEIEAEKQAEAAAEEGEEAKEENGTSEEEKEEEEEREEEIEQDDVEKLEDTKDSQPSEETTSSSLVTPSSRQNQPLSSTPLSPEKSTDKTPMHEGTHKIPAVTSSTTTETTEQSANNKEIALSDTDSGLQARITERARQREAQESAEKTRSAPGKTSSRSELLERARNARRQSAAAATTNDSGSTQDVSGAKKAPLTAAERVAARRNFAATRTNSSRQLKGGSSHNNNTKSAVGLSEARRAQIRNGIRAGNGTAAAS